MGYRNAPAVFDVDQGNAACFRKFDFAAVVSTYLCQLEALQGARFKAPMSAAHSGFPAISFPRQYKRFWEV